LVIVKQEKGGATLERSKSVTVSVPVAEPVKALRQASMGGAKNGAAKATRM
jgi:hypothetical protein